MIESRLWLKRQKNTSKRRTGQMVKGLGPVDIESLTACSNKVAFQKC